jgi:hypothetical protein
LLAVLHDPNISFEFPERAADWKFKHDRASTLMMKDVFVLFNNITIHPQYSKQETLQIFTGSQFNFCLSVLGFAHGAELHGLTQNRMARLAAQALSFQ